MLTLSIGDVHGTEYWKSEIFGSIENYELFRKTEKFDLNEFDKIIFVGDYVDSFTVSNSKILQNLQDIIHLKKSYPEKVELLLGNHDVQYIVQVGTCSGYRPEMRPDLHQIFRENENLFKIAHLENDVLWTHAGLSSYFYHNFVMSMDDEKYRFYDIFKDIKTIDEQLNFMWKANNQDLFMSASNNGGKDICNGPLWLRPDELLAYPLKGFVQIYGHTPLKQIREDKGKYFRHICIDVSEYGEKKSFRFVC